MPQLTDPNFARTVVLLCEHGPEGALGLVVNRTAEVGAAEAVEFEPPLEAPNQIPLHLVNSTHIQRKLEQGPKLKSLLRSSRPSSQLTEELYLTLIGITVADCEKRLVAHFGEKFPTPPNNRIKLLFQIPDIVNFRNSFRF